MPVFFCDGFDAVEYGGDRFAWMAVGHPVDLSGVAGPVAELGLRVVGQRSDDGDVFDCVGSGAVVFDVQGQ